MTCEFKDYSVDGYNCQVTNLHIEDDTNTAIESVEGKHRPGKSNDNVAVLYIASSHSNCIKHIPTGVGSIFKNLEKIQVIEVPLAVISSIDFIGISSLRIVEIRKTFLALLPEDTFNNLLKLEILILNDNRIQELKSNTFRNLINLKKLQLAGNLMLSLPTELFVANVKLEEIDLSANKLKLVDDSIFDTLRNATKISMADNFCIVEDAPLSVLKLEIAEKCRHGNQLVSETNLTKSRDEIQSLLESNHDLNWKLQRAYEDIKYVKKLFDELQANFTKIDDDCRTTLEAKSTECEIILKTSESSANVIRDALISSSLILAALLIMLIVIVITLGFIINKQRKAREQEEEEEAGRLTNLNMRI